MRESQREEKQETADSRLCTVSFLYPSGGSRYV